MSYTDIAGGFAGAGNIDAYGNVIPEVGSLSASLASGPGELASEISANGEQEIATFTNLMIYQSGLYTLSIASAAGRTSATSVPFLVSPAEGSRIEITTQPEDRVAGETYSVQVTVKDVFGNVATTTDLKLTVELDSGPDGAELGGTKTTDTVGGVAAFLDLALTRAGEHTVTVSGNGLGSATSESFTISPGAVAGVAFTAQSGVLGALLQARVALRDAYGNAVTTSDGVVTIGLASGPDRAVLTVARSTENGTATFAGLSVPFSGEYTLTASYAGGLGATAAFTVSPASGPRPVAFFSPTSVVAGAKAGPVEIEGQDATGHRLTTDKSKAKVYLTSAPTKALGKVSLKAGKGLLKSFSVKTAGTYTPGVSAASRISATSAAFVVTPGAAAKMTASVPATTAVNSPFAATVRLFDKLGNELSAGGTAVALGLKSGPKGAVLSGAAAPFSGVSVSLAGKYGFAAASRKLKATSKPLVAHQGDGGRLTPTLLLRPGGRTRDAFAGATRASFHPGLRPTSLGLRGEVRGQKLAPRHQGKRNSAGVLVLGVGILLRP